MKLITVTMMIQVKDENFDEGYIRKLKSDEAIDDFKRDTKAEMVDIEVIVENN
jgi:hypothetical protein